MPLYEYECFLCGTRFERIQRATAEPLRVCPECGGAVRRLLGVPALQFKGSGWYVTDYGGGRSQGTTSASNGNGNGSGEKSNGAGSSEEKTAPRSSETD